MRHTQHADHIQHGQQAGLQQPCARYGYCKLLLSCWGTPARSLLSNTDPPAVAAARCRQISIPQEFEGRQCYTHLALLDAQSQYYMVAAPTYNFTVPGDARGVKGIFDFNFTSLELLQASGVW